MSRWINFSDMTNKDLMKLSAIGAVGITVLYGIYKRRSRRTLSVPNFENDKVYLCCFPRPKEGIIQLSPFCLKLEAWFRMNKIDFEYINTMQPSRNGQFPYVEYNGKEYPDSNLIIDEFTTMLNADADKDLTLEQKGAARAIKHMCEFSLAQSYAIYRYAYNLDEFMGIMKSSFPQFKLWLSLPWSKWALRRNVMRRMMISGYGRLTQEEAHMMGCKDIKAISNYLGSKQFLMGDKLTSVDCWVFAHMAQVLFNPMPTNPQADCVNSHAVNVRDYMERIKTGLFPDWDRLLAAAGKGNYLAKA